MHQLWPGLEQFSAVMESAESATLNLVDIAWDLQITICIFLHPFDILTMREVCH